LFKQTLSSRSRAINIVETWYLFVSLLHIGGVHRKTFSHSSHLDLFINLLVNVSVSRVIYVKLRPYMLRSLNGAWISKLPVLLLLVNGLTKESCFKSYT
jgi:hypothetical protein